MGLLAQASTYLSRLAPFSPSPIDRLIGSECMMIVSNGLAIINAVVAIALVRSVDRNQDARYRLVLQQPAVEAEIVG